MRTFQSAVRFTYRFTVFGLALLGSISSTHAQDYSAQQDIAAKKQEQAAIANQMAAFLPEIPSMLAHKLSDYPHARFRNVTISVVIPMDRSDSYYERGFILCGEASLNPQDSEAHSYAGWQSFVIDRGLVHGIRDVSSVTFAQKNPESAEFVNDLCVRNVMGARLWSDTAYYTKAISADGKYLRSPDSSGDQRH